MNVPVPAKKFKGKTSAEAMAKVKAELGDKAILLHQETLVELTVSIDTGQNAKLQQFYGHTVVEAMATICDKLGPDACIVDQQNVVELTVSAASSGCEPKQKGGVGNALLKRVYAGGKMGTQPGVTVNGGAEVVEAGGIKQPQKFSLQAINAKLDEVLRLTKNPDRPAVSETLTGFYLRMLENDVSEELARHLVEKLNAEVEVGYLDDKTVIREAMLEAISRLIPVNGPIVIRGDGLPTVVAVVGPTGVGKTTSIAKMAMQLKLSQKCRVSLITEDTTRPGAAEQLRSVAQLLSIPFTVADTVERIKYAIKAGGDRDVILVDTAGRVPRNRKALQELTEFLDQLEPDEVHLALCSLSGHRHILETIRQFKLVDFDRIILTKLDEATTYGIILNIAAHVDHGMSYITTGQDYMENLETGDAKRLAALVLGDPLHAPGLAIEE